MMAGKTVHLDNISLQKDHDRLLKKKTSIKTIYNIITVCSHTHFQRKRSQKNRRIYFLQIFDYFRFALLSWYFPEYPQGVCIAIFRNYYLK